MLTTFMNPKSEKESLSQQMSQTERVPVRILAVRKRGQEFFPRQIVRGENGGEEGGRAVRGDAKGKGKGKGKEQPRAPEAVEAEPKGKQVEQPVQVNTKGKQPEQPIYQGAVQVEPKGKHVERLVPATIKGKQPEQLRPQQPVQGEPKSKQVEQPIQGSRKSKQPQQTPPEPSKPPTVVKGKQTQDLTSEQRLQVRPTLQSPLRKAILANANPVYHGSQKVFIARIPAKMKAKRSMMHRVEVSIIADTLCRHPQTFFFKNLPDVENYWGALNDAATTARRIVRLEMGGQPIPYFLLVSKGELPKADSPRNDNIIFADMHVPIFGDAFIFKLAYVELDENGYARYVNVEDEVGSIDWLPEAIREAARKVDNATAAEANPGFPDVENDADPETMRKYVQSLLRHRDPMQKAARKYGSGLLVDPRSGLPGVMSMGRNLTGMAKKVGAWRDEGVLRMDIGPKSADFKTFKDFHEKALVAFYAILDCTNGMGDLRGASSASVDLGSSETKTTDSVERVKKSFRAASDAFDEVRAVRRVNAARKVIKALNVDEIPKRIHMEDIHHNIEAVLRTLADWERNRDLSAHAKNGPFDPKIVDEFVKRVRGADQAMEAPGNESKPKSDINKVNAAFESIKVNFDKQKVLPKMKVAKKAEAPRKADNTRCPELPDLPGYPGTSRPE